MHHHSKADRLQMTHRGDIGYELQSSLLVTDRDAAPTCTPLRIWRSRTECSAREPGREMSDSETRKVDYKGKPAIQQTV
jgi:hypothetical protein